MFVNIMHATINRCSLLYFDSNQLHELANSDTAGKQYTTPVIKRQQADDDGATDRL